MVNDSRNQDSMGDSSDASLPQIALIGCGAIAESYYLPALARQPGGLDNLILVDQDRARAQTLATKFNVKRYLNDYRQVLSEVEGAIIALPTHLHYPIGMDFLSRGMHVLCEKPLAESADKAKEMVEQAHKTGAILATDYLQRLWPQFAKVKEMLRGKSLGEPLSIKYYVGEVFDWPTVSGFYFNSAKSATGVLRDRGAHVFDHICWWLGGKPTLISSQNDSFGGVESVAQVRFEQGRCVGEVKLSWLTNFPCKFSVKCERGTIEGDVYDFKRVSITEGTTRQKRIDLKSEIKSKSDAGYRMVGDFIDVITKGGEPIISGRDALDSIEFIDECYGAATRFDMPWYKFTEAENGS